MNRARLLDSSPLLSRFQRNDVYGKIKVVILTCYSTNNFHHVLFYGILDSYHDFDSRDWSNFNLEEFTKAQARSPNYEDCGN